MMLLSVDDWWYPILIVECLFVGAHSDVRIHEEPEDDSRLRHRMFTNTRQHRYNQQIVSDPTGVRLILSCFHLSWLAVTCLRCSGWGYFHQGVSDSSIARRERQLKVIKWSSRAIDLLFSSARGSISKSDLFKMKLWWWYI